MWVIQAGDDLGFALKPLPATGIRTNLCRENLDGDRSFQAGVSRTIHFSRFRPRLAAQRSDTDPSFAPFSNATTARIIVL